MEKLIKWIEENSADGAKLEEAKQLVQELDVTPKSREEAAKLIDSNQHIKSELDSRISKSVDNATEKFKESKLPEILEEEREKIRKELNPEETPEQKEIRELRERLNKQESVVQTEQRKAELRAKAKEIGIDPLRAERYVAYGDDAEKMLTEDAELLQTQINQRIEDEIKKRYGGAPPLKGDEKPANQLEDLKRQYDEAMQSRDAGKAMEIKEQIRKAQKTRTQE